MTRPHQFIFGRRASLGVALSAVFWPLACDGGEAPARPGGIDSGATPGPRAGTEGDGGEGGAPSGEGTVEGVVVQYSDDSFLSTSPFRGAADITFLNSTGTSQVGVRYDGNSFAGQGMILGQNWIYVEPDDASGYPTMTAQTVTEEGFEAPVISRALLDDIFLNLTTAAELEPNRAQLMLLVVDESGNPVPGVEADPFAARPPFVAYKQNANWVSYLDETTSDGLVFVPNLEALAFPGQAVQVILSGAVDAELDVRLARGAITLMTHVVP